MGSTNFRQYGSLWQATLLLTLAGVLARLWGLAYRVLTARFLGAEGLGIYQIAVTFYFAIVTPMTSGTPSAVARAVASRGHSRTYAISRVVSHGLLLSIVAGFMGFIVTGVALNSHFPAAEIARRYVPWWSFCPAIVFAVLCASIRGYFLGVKDIGPILISEQAEEVSRLLWIILAWIGVAHGAMPARLFDIRVRVIWVVMGIIWAEMAGMLVLKRYYDATPAVWRPSERTSGRPRKGSSGSGKWQQKIFWELLSLEVPIGLNRLIGSLLHLAEASMIPQRLVLAGYSPGEAIAAYGRITGMALPLFFIPSVLTGSLALAMVPGMSEAGLTPFRARERARKSLWAVVVTGAISTAVFSIWGRNITFALYGDVMAGDILKRLAPLAVFIYLDQASCGILRGIGKAFVPIISDGLGAVLRLGLIWLWAANENFGVSGVVYGMMAGEVLCSILNSAAANYYLRK